MSISDSRSAEILDAIGELFEEVPEDSPVPFDTIRDKLVPRFGAEAVEKVISFLKPASTRGAGAKVTPSRKTGRGGRPSRKTGRGGRPKGYAEWNPHQGTRVILDQVREILSNYRAYLPLTARQVFYILVGNYGYPKDERAYERLTNYLNRARRADIIDFADLRDDGITVSRSAHYADADDFYSQVRKMGERYKRDKLSNQPVNMRVLCEAAGMMPQLARVAVDYSVPVYSCSGFDSLTAKYELARAITEDYTYNGKPTVVLHLGDYDPSGVSIYDSMVEDVQAFVGEDVLSSEPEEVARFHRVALTPDQIEEYDVTTYPPKASDQRSKRWIAEGRMTCQLEALPPDDLARELEIAIEEHLNSDLLEDDRREEEEERRRITRALPSADEGVA